jgi:hypothetical protein
VRASSLWEKQACGRFSDRASVAGGAGVPRKSRVLMTGGELASRGVRDFLGWR